MDINTIKIVMDSSADLLSMDGVSYASAPLKIITANEEYVDDAALDVPAMVESLLQYTGKSSTACPAPGDWTEAFGDAENIFVLTITSNLSGSYNAACIAARDYEVTYPDRRVFVLDTLTTGPEMALLAEKIVECVKTGMEFDEVCRAVEEYRKKTTALIFVLESMQNLANNGRVSRIVAKAAGILGIRAIGCASVRGDLEMMDKARGAHRTIPAIVDNMKKMGYCGGKVRITHVVNPGAAVALKELICSEFGDVVEDVYPARGLCSFYAEKGGLLIGFERVKK